MNLTKKDIALAIHEADSSISMSDAIALVDGIFGAIKARLARGEKVMITNFGTFQVVERAARKGINPATGQSLVISSHRAVSFRPAPAVEAAIGAPEGLGSEPATSAGATEAAAAADAVVDEPAAARRGSDEPSSLDVAWWRRQGTSKPSE